MRSVPVMIRVFCAYMKGLAIVTAIRRIKRETDGWGFESEGGKKNKLPLSLSLRRLVDDRNERGTV